MIPHATNLISDFVCLQQKLGRVLFESFQPNPELTNLPKRGNINNDGELWEFARHGKGVSFRSLKTGVEVDVTEHLELLDSLDSWRFETYCESLEIEIVYFNSRKFVTDSDGLRTLFMELMLAGWLEPVSSSHGLLRLIPK